MKVFKTITGNLPAELLNQKRFFCVANKEAPPSGWNKPENQTLATNINGLMGCDISGHDVRDDYTLIDFDHVLDDQGNFIYPDAEKWYNYAQSTFDNAYCELSQSRHGLHIFCKPTPGKFGKIVNKDGEGVLWFNREKGAKIEIFYKNAARYCLMTGELFKTDSKVIAEGDAADEFLTNILTAIKPPVQVNVKAEQPTVDDADDIKALANIINSSVTLDAIIKKGYLQHSENGAPAPTGFICPWCGSGTHVHKTGALTFYAEPNPHFACHSCSSGGDIIKFLSKVYGIENRGKDYFKLLRKIADDFNIPYDPKIFEYKPKFSDNVENLAAAIVKYAESSSEIDEWQQDNGAIDPKFLAKLKSEAQRISNITDFAAAARSTATLRFLGAFQYYSCFSNVAEKFFTDYARARDEAKKRIRAYDKAQNGDQFYFMAKGSSAAVDVQTKPPSDSDIALANMPAPKALKDSTATYKTEAKKAHKTYLIQKEADEINAQRRAAEEAYNLNPETTKKNLPDCPIDLILPRGVYFSEQGISIVDFDAPAKNRAVKAACENPVVPVRAFREVTENGAEPKQGNQYEIAIKTQSDWVYTTVDAQKLTDARKVSDLAKYGALISSPTFFAKAMTKIIAQNERNGILKSVRVFTKPGWHGDEFIYPTGGDDYIVSNGSFNYKGVFTPRGDKKKWLKLIKRALFHDPKHYDPTRFTSIDSSGNETIVTPETNISNISSAPNINFAFVLGFCAAAPLVHVLGIRNPQGVFGLDSGNGKTAAASLAVSLFGKVKKGLMSRLNATANYLEDNAVALNDFPQVIDELQSANKKRRDFDLDTMIYDYADGITRGRADITGKGRPTEEYRGCRFFTGEQTIIRENSGQGAVSRIFEIKKEEIFADPFAVEIHKFVAENYGFFGREFTTEFIPNNREQIKEYFAQKEKFFSSGANDLLSSHATIFAYAFTGLKFVLEFLQFKNVDEIIFDLIVAAQELIDDAPTKSGASNVERALPALLDYFDKFPKNFIHEIKTNGTKEFVAAEGNATFGVKLLDGSYAIIPTVLRKIISDDLDLSNASAIIRGLGKKGYLDFGKAKKQDFKKRLSEEFNDWYGKTAWFYVFRPADFLLEKNAA